MPARSHAGGGQSVRTARVRPAANRSPAVRVPAARADFGGPCDCGLLLQMGAPWDARTYDLATEPQQSVGVRRARARRGHRAGCDGVGCRLRDRARHGRAAGARTLDASRRRAVAVWNGAKRGCQARRHTRPYRQSSAPSKCGGRTISTEMNTALREAIFSLGPHIRYVAFGDGQRGRDGTARRDRIRVRRRLRLLRRAPRQPHAADACPSAWRSRLRRPASRHRRLRELQPGCRSRRPRDTSRSAYSATPTRLALRADVAELLERP